MADDKGTVLLEGVKIIFRNFAGKEGQYNRDGDRNFGVIIPDPKVAEAMLKDGWNVKYLKPSEEEKEQGEEHGPPWLSVKVGYGKGAPPKVTMITESRGRTALDEDLVEMLDWADIINADLVVRPYHYDVNGRQGISAYLKTLFVTIDEDELEKKYADLDAQ